MRFLLRLLALSSRLLALGSLGSLLYLSAGWGRGRGQLANRCTSLWHLQISMLGKLLLHLTSVPTYGRIWSTWSLPYILRAPCCRSRHVPCGSHHLRSHLRGHHRGLVRSLPAHQQPRPCGRSHSSLRTCGASGSHRQTS